jgi:hypothetical protein
MQTAILDAVPHTDTASFGLSANYKLLAWFPPFFKYWFTKLNSLLHFDLNVVPFEPFDHELIFLTWRKPGPDWFPRTTTTNAAVFRLGDTDETFFRHGIDRMVVHLVPKFKFPRHRMLTWQRV